MKELIRTAICYIAISVFVGIYITFIAHRVWIKERVTEVQAKDYVYAKKFYSNHIATKKLYCKFLKDHFLSEYEDFKLLKTYHTYNTKISNEKAKTAADSIKAEGCTP